MCRIVGRLPLLTVMAVFSVEGDWDFRRFSRTLVPQLPQEGSVSFQFGGAAEGFSEIPTLVLLILTSALHIRGVRLSGGPADRSEVKHVGQLRIPAMRRRHFESQTAHRNTTQPASRRCSRQNMGLGLELGKPRLQECWRNEEWSAHREPKWGLRRRLKKWKGSKKEARGMEWKWSLWVSTDRGRIKRMVAQYQPKLSTSEEKRCSNLTY